MTCVAPESNYNVISSVHTYLLGKKNLLLMHQESMIPCSLIFSTLLICVYIGCYVKPGNVMDYHVLGHSGGYLIPLPHPAPNVYLSNIPDSIMHMHLLPACQSLSMILHTHTNKSFISHAKHTNIFQK